MQRESEKERERAHVCWRVHERKIMRVCVCERESEREREREKEIEKERERERKKEKERERGNKTDRSTLDVRQLRGLF